MSTLHRIGAAVLVLIALVPATFNRANVLCVESSGRITLGCDDVVPDEISVSSAAPIHLGLSSVACGMCHDYTVGQAVSHTVEDSVPPLAVTGFHLATPSMRTPLLLNALKTIAVLDSSGSSSPLKC